MKQSKSMRNVVSITMVLLLFSACSIELEKKTISEKLVAERKTEFKYLALGDSYTIGESVDRKKCYPNLLKDALVNAGFLLDSVTIIAKTGWTTEDLKNGIVNREIEGNKYDLVTLLIGVNNQYQGLDIETYRKEFISLLKQAISFASDDPKKVIVISIPDWGVTPFASDRDNKQIAFEIDNYNAIKKEETQKLNVSFIDITTFSRKVDKHPELVATDGLHPSGEMYLEWVNRMFPVAKQILEK